MANKTFALRSQKPADLPVVLLVEDEPTARQSMRVFLKTCGYASIEAPTVERAVGALSDGINAAVVDVQLAGDRSGLEVLTPLRLRPELADIPVIVLTGGVLTDAEEALIKQQHAYVFYKPEACETIVSLLDRFTGGPSNRPGRSMPASASLDEGLRKDFLAQTQRETWWLQSSLAAGLDYPRADHVVHRWIGVGGTLGFAEISRRALEIQSLLSEPGATTTDRLRSAVNEMARLCSEAAQASPESKPALRGVVNAIAGSLVGRKVALVGFDPADAAWMAHALEQVQAFSRVVDPDDAGVAPHAFEPFDLVAVAASPRSGAVARTSAEAATAMGLPLLVVGAAGTVAEQTATFHDAAHDFLITPCSPEEFVLRASRLLCGAGTPPRLRADSSNDGPARVIVADDDPTITALVKAALQNYEFECHIARDGGEALELTRTLRPDALILDVNMPQFDGFEVLHTLKNDPVTAGVAVVLLSGRQQETDIMRGFGLGADDYVVKPFSPVELIARVKRLLRKRVA